MTSTVGPAQNWLPPIATFGVIAAGKVSAAEVTDRISYRRRHFLKVMFRVVPQWKNSVDGYLDGLTTKSVDILLYKLRCLAM